MDNIAFFFISEILTIGIIYYNITIYDDSVNVLYSVYPAEFLNWTCPFTIFGTVHDFRDIKTS